MIHSPTELQEYVAAQMQALQQAATALLRRHADLYQAKQEARTTGDGAEVTRLKLEIAQVEREICGLFVGRML